MNLKKQNGITLVALIITIVLIVIIAGVTIKQGNNVINSAKLQNLNTNMLLIQSKAKIIYEHHAFNNQEELLGQNVSSIENNEKIENLKTLGILEANETEEAQNAYADYYVWDQTILNDEKVGLNDIKLKNDFYIVNYAAEEVIYSDGFKYSDGQTYYKLSQTIDLR